MIVLGGMLLTGCAGAKQNQMGKTLLETGDYDRAVTLLREAVEKDPGNNEYIDRLSDALTQAADFHFEKAKTLHSQQKPGKALEELDLALGYMPGHPQAVLARRSMEADAAVCSRLRKQAEEAATREEWDEALRLADQAHRADQGDAEATALFERTRSVIVARHLAQAQVALEGGDREKCAAECAQVKVWDASNPLVAQIEQKLAKSGGAAGAVAAAVPPSPTSAPAVVSASPRTQPAATPLSPPQPSTVQASPPAIAVATTATRPAAAVAVNAAVTSPVAVQGSQVDATKPTNVAAAARPAPAVNPASPSKRGLIEVSPASRRASAAPRILANQPSPSGVAAGEAKAPAVTPPRRTVAGPPLIEVSKSAGHRRVVSAADPINGIGGKPPGPSLEPGEYEPEPVLPPPTNGVHPVVPREPSLAGATFFTKRDPAKLPPISATRPASTQPTVLSGEVVKRPTGTVRTGPSGVSPPQPVAGRIVTPRPRGLILPRSSESVSQTPPSAPERLFRGTVSRDDDRYDKSITSIDGITVKIRDTDDSPLDADLEITAGKFEVSPDDLPVGAGIRVQGVSGAAYRLLIIWIDDENETVHFAIDTLN